MTVSIQSFRPTLIAGQCYLRPVGAAAPLRAIGNVSALDLEIDEETKTLNDYTQPGGGQWAEVSRVKSIKASMKLHDLDGPNLALGCYGAVTEVAANTVAAETATAYQGGLIRLAHPAPSAVTVTSAAAAWVAQTAYALGAVCRKTTTNGHVYVATAAGTSGATEPTWKTDGTATTDGTVTWADLGVFAAVANTDYEVRPEGLMIAAAGIPHGCPISIAYTHGAYSVVEAMVQGQQVYEFSFGGLNEANSASPVVVDVWRLQLSAAAKISLLGDDFLALEVKGGCLKDVTKGVGKSGYFRTQMV